ncbi:MAG: formylmethionine deformylase [Bacteroides sp. SM23_62]|nr:MAG: formylmethionine deformylase [Bacteroides sp. SM23_62]
MLENIIKLGDPRLYVPSEPVSREEINSFHGNIMQMADCIVAFREKYGQGRAIAAPQIGLPKKMIVINMDHPYPIFNPEFIDKSNDMFEIWDDCMSFPELFVKVKRHKSVKMKFRDKYWQEQVWELEDDMAELLQHEYDHLDGILATMLAVDNKSFRWRS